MKCFRVALKRPWSWHVSEKPLLLCWCRTINFTTSFPPSSQILPSKTLPFLPLTQTDVHTQSLRRRNGGTPILSFLQRRRQSGARRTPARSVRAALSVYYFKLKHPAQQALEQRIAHLRSDVFAFSAAALAAPIWTLRRARCQQSTHRSNNQLIQHLNSA